MVSINKIKLFICAVLLTAVFQVALYMQNISRIITQNAINKSSSYIKAQNLNESIQETQGINMEETDLYVKNTQSDFVSSKHQNLRKTYQNVEEKRAQLQDKNTNVIETHQQVQNTRQNSYETNNIDREIQQYLQQPLSKTHNENGNITMSRNNASEKEEVTNIAIDILKDKHKVFKPPQTLNSNKVSENPTSEFYNIAYSKQSVNKIKSFRQISNHVNNHERLSNETNKYYPLNKYVKTLTDNREDVLNKIFDIYQLNRAIPSGTKQRIKQTTNRLSGLKYEHNSNMNVHKLNKQLKIVYYNPNSEMLETNVDSLNMDRCVYDNCIVTKQTQLTSNYINADAILIEGQKAPDEIPRHRDENQVFVFFQMESPVNLYETNLLESNFRRYYNWTMTYRLDSDITLSYGVVVNKYAALDAGSDWKGLPNKDYEQIFRQKTKSAAWVVSHCKTHSEREGYVTKMIKHIGIDVFGECTGEECSHDCIDTIKEEYKFYLGFENSLCRDYVTEKAFKWITRDIILVIRGASNCMEQLPEGTYINARNFKSPEKLAQYLNMLGNNEKRYISMLKHKDKYTTMKRDVHFLQSFCYLCKKLNTNRKHKTINSIYHWWKQGSCNNPKDY